MKVIDLLNKIANGEEAPKRIRFEDEIYYLSDNNETYIGTISHSAIGRKHCLEQCLTDEVEIIEEDKKIENLYYMGEDKTDKLIMIRDKINEIIDKINKE